MNHSQKMNTPRFNLILLTLLLLGIMSAQAQTYDTLKVASYNVLNYPGNSSATRNPEFRKVLRAMNPDVLIVQEMTSSAGVSEFLSQVLNNGQPGTYANAPFSNGPDSDNALFYKPARVSFLSQIVLGTMLRDINGYVLRPSGVFSDSLDFRVYSAHFRSSMGEESARFAEADTLRNHLNSLGPGYYIVGGDFNLYTSSEAAYQELIGSQSDNDGRVYDPLGMPGSWHDNATFAAIHTQSPRVANLGDGGATGGLDDRFDFLLPTFPFQTLPGWQLVPGSYITYGNDGAHFGQAVNNGTNFVVPDSIADALHAASDHLPVMLSIVRQVTPPPSVAVLSPNGGESFGTGDTVLVSWNTTSYTGTVSISLSRTGPAGPFVSLILGTENDGAFKWIASGSATSSARVKVEMDSSPAFSDLSNANFSITQRELAVLTPTDGSTFAIGTLVEVNWLASGLPGNVRVELQRVPSMGTWELLAASVPNSGSYLWTATGSATDSALIRVSSVEAPALADSSGMFRVVLPTLTLTRPNGAESFTSGFSEAVQWSQTSLTGQVALEINRDYPAGVWEPIAASVPVVSSPYNWLVTGPATEHARLRIRSLSLPQVGDTSAGDFSITVTNQPPSIGHNQVCDDFPGIVTFFCLVTDDGAFSLPRLIWSSDNFLSTDILALSPIGDGKHSVEAQFDEGFYRYYLEVTDTEDLVSRTDTHSFRVFPECGVVTGYDDGSAESYQWSSEAGFLWATRITPPATPFVICATDFAASVRKPDTVHTQVRVFVLEANGVGGLPGDTLGQFTAGVLPNPSTGVYGQSPDWGHVALLDPESSAITVTGDFYVGISACSTAFGLDSAGAGLARSLVWDPCEEAWLPEDGLHPSTRSGLRMIRVSGWPLLPPTVVILASGNDIILNWPSTGAPNYQVFRSTSPFGPFDSFIAQTTDTTYIDENVIQSLGTAFYLVRSSN